MLQMDINYYSEGASFTKKYNNGWNSNYGDSFAPGDLISVAMIWIMEQSLSIKMV